MAMSGAGLAIAVVLAVAVGWWAHRRGCFDRFAWLALLLWTVSQDGTGLPSTTLTLLSAPMVVAAAGIGAARLWWGLTRGDA